CHAFNDSAQHTGRFFCKLWWRVYGTAWVCRFYTGFIANHRSCRIWRVFPLVGPGTLQRCRHGRVCSGLEQYIGCSHYKFVRTCRHILLLAFYGSALKWGRGTFFPLSVLLIRISYKGKETAKTLSPLCSALSCHFIFHKLYYMHTDS